MTSQPRTPPHSFDAERAVIGAVLLQPSVYDDVGADLAATDFFDPRNATVWDAFSGLNAAHRPLDVISLRDFLNARERLPRAGGDDYLLGLGSELPSAAFAPAHARTVRQLAQRRRMISACLEQAARGYDLTVESPAFLAETEARVSNVASSAETTEGLRHVRESIAASFENIQRAAAAGGNGVTGLASGLLELDHRTTGLHPGEFIVVGGRPGMGKSSLARLFAVSGAHTGKPAAVFSLEMADADVARAFLAAEAELDIQQLRSARIGQEGWRRLASAAGSLSHLPMFIDETPGISLATLRARCRRLRAKEGPLSVVVIDYIQLMRGSGRGDNREQEISEVSRGCKELAKELGCPVVGLVQLNRKVEERADKRPMLSDIRESGSLEQDADLVLFLYRDAYYAARARHEESKRRGSNTAFTPPPVEDDESAEIIIAKQRSGPQCTVNVRFIAPYAHYTNLASEGYGFE